MSAIVEGEEVNNVEGDIDIHQLALGIAPLCSGDPEKVFRGCASLFTDDESMDRQQFKLAVTAWLRLRTVPSPRGIVFQRGEDEIEELVNRCFLQVADTLYERVSVDILSEILLKEESSTS